MTGSNSIVRRALPLLLAVCVLVTSGCSLFRRKPKVFRTEAMAIQAMNDAGIDAFALAEFNKVDRLIESGELRTARALLAGMPPPLQDTPPYHYRVAYIAMLDADYPKAIESIEKAKVRGGFSRESARLAIFLYLLNGDAVQAGALSAEILLAAPRETLVWQYFLDAARRAPLTKGTQGAVNALIQRYQRRLPESRALSAIMSFVSGQNDTALKWMDELAREWPANVTIQRLYLDMLRNVGDIEKTARVAEKLARQLPPSSPFRANLAEELESIRIALLQRQSDPLPAAITFDLKGEAFLDLDAQLPPGVPSNQNDPRDGMPPDYLDPDGEPLYFLPFKAGSIRFLGVRPDGEPIGRAPEMEDPEKDYRPRHAFCFLMPRGTPVLAARGGVVQRVSVKSTDDDPAEYARVIEIYHRDGTIARYWHPERYSVAVMPGDTVYRGQVIAGSGMTGLSRHQHLRFEVVKPAEKNRKWWEPYKRHTTIPVRFADVTEENGVPREGRWYRSRNVWVPNVY